MDISRLGIPPVREATATTARIVNIRLCAEANKKQKEPIAKVRAKIVQVILVEILSSSHPQPKLTGMPNRDARDRKNKAWGMEKPTSRNRGINWLIIPVIIRLSNPKDTI